MAYTVQTTLDALHNISIDFKVTTENDYKIMGGMLRRAKNILGHNNFTAIYDKSYHTGSASDYVNRLDVEVLLAIPGVSSRATYTAFTLEYFKYNIITNSYTCPANETLTANGTW